MTERKKKLLSLLVSSTLLFNLVGCSSITRKTNAVNEIVYTGNISFEALENLYVVEIIDLKNHKQLYLTEKVSMFGGGFKFKILGTQNIILEINKENNLITNYGKVENIVSFPQFIITYTELKETYNADEITKIFESVKEEYDEIIKNDNIKKLKLK